MTDTEEVENIVDLPQDVAGKIIEIEGRPKAIWVHEHGATEMTEWMPVPRIMPLGMNVMPLPSEIVIPMYLMARGDENVNEALNNYLAKYGLTGLSLSEDSIKAICKNRNAEPDNQDNPWHIIEVQVVLDGIRVVE